jgi:hypothetical protein
MSVLLSLFLTFAMSLTVSGCLGGGGGGGGGDNKASIRGLLRGLYTGVVLPDEPRRLVLSLNNAHDLVLSTGDSNKFFEFPKKLDKGSNYNVKVKTQPLNHYCQVQNGQGVADKNVTNIRVICIETRLNDTGVDWWSDGVVKSLVPEPAYPDQDADHGRDAFARDGQLFKYGNGMAGFDFTKLDGVAGDELPDVSPVWDCVRDNVTGLVWTASGPAANWADAGTQALTKIAQCGVAAWRLPTVHELVSIAHSGKDFPPAVDEDFFDFITAGKYWTGSEYDKNPVDAWIVDFGDDGGVEIQDKTNIWAVILVGGGPTGLPGVRFAHSPSKVIDKHTKLMWLETGNTLRTWEDSLKAADAYSKDTVLGKGYDDWRVPNRHELVSLVDYTESDPSVEGTVETTLQINSLPYWTSTPAPVGLHDRSWGVDLDDGSTTLLSIITIRRTLLVRNCIDEAVCH